MTLAPELLGALLCLSLLLLVVVGLGCAAVIWLWSKLAKFRQLRIERIGEIVDFHGSVDR
jgi:hypothetical protein